MTTDQNPEPLRIPIGRNITYAVRGMPPVANAYGPGFLVPTEVSLTYRANEDSRLGRLHAYVKGQWLRDGEVVPSGQKLPGQHYSGDPSGWPTWLAEEARLHDPAAVSVPPSAGIDRRAQLLDALDFAYCQGLGFDTPEALLDAYDASRGVPVPPPADQTALRQRIAEAARTVRLRLGPNAIDAVKRGESIILSGGEADDVADAVMAVLPEQTDRAAADVERDQLRAAWETLARCNREDAAVLIELGRLVGVAPFGDRTVSVRTAVEALGTALRRVAAEEQPTETHARRLLTPGEYDSAWHAVEGAAGEEGADPGTILHAVLNRLGIDADDAPAVGEQPAKSDRCPHGCDTSICPCLACEADEEPESSAAPAVGEQPETQEAP